MRAKIGFASNSFDAKKLGNRLKGKDNTANDISYSIKNENYTDLNLMLRPNLSVQEKRLNTGISLIAGYMTVFNPGFEVTATLAGNSAKHEIKEKSVSSEGLAFGGGLWIKYMINSKLNLNLKVDYLSESIEYNSITQTVKGCNMLEHFRNT